MKKTVFHQFIRVERGKSKSLIVDFLKEKYFHLENKQIFVPIPNFRANPDFLLVFTSKSV
jgi:hypothetical protein